jgi:DNA-directed RNA polymerase subunit beta
MSESTLSEFVERKDFSRIRTSIDIPDLIEIQKRSYEEFLQMEVEPDRRKDQGLQAALASVFPITDYNNTAALEFSNYSLGTPKYDERECLEQGMTFAVPLKLRVRLIVFDKEDKGPKKKVLDVREQEVYVGELPLMTERGTFLINGTERVVVSQLHRSPARRSRTIRGGPMPAARCCILPGLFPIADPGSISSSTHGTFFTFASIAVAKCLRRSC